MVKKYVYGVYPTVVEAEDAITHVINQGVPRESVALVGTRAHAYNGEAEFISYGELLEEQHEDNRGFFAKLFGWDDNDHDEEFENVDFTEYEDSLNRDELLVLVDQEFESQLQAIGEDETAEYRPETDETEDRTVVDNTDPDTLNAETAAFTGAVGSTTGVTEDYDETIVDEGAARNYDEVNVVENEATNKFNNVDNDTNHDYDDINVEDNDYEPHYVGEETHIESTGGAYSDPETETDRIRLHEEQVHAETRKRDVGEVSISKEVVEETETIEVPVEREEIHIRHTKPTEGTLDDDDAFVEEDIVIPVTEEEVVVDKDTVVTDEIEVEKTRHTDNETVTETTRREELDINDETGRIIEDDDTLR